MTGKVAFSAKRRTVDLPPTTLKPKSSNVKAMRFNDTPSRVGLQTFFNSGMGMGIPYHLHIIDMQATPQSMASCCMATGILRISISPFYHLSWVYCRPIYRSDTV